MYYDLCKSCENDQENRPCDSNFRDGASQSNEYTYDKNGNMTKDLNKNISSIQYNSLNLPSKVVFSDGKYMDYVYSATGEKRSVTYNVLSSDGSYTYCDNFIYYNGDLNKILVDGGYISISGTTPTYHYYLKDHLGNNRVVVDASGTVKQVTHYYPFGGFFGESTGSSYQAYKYNGKEFERLISEDWYDYGARHMDGMRFTTMDPMAEKYYSISPYAYCHNNPINRIDPNGEYDFENTIEKNTNYTVVAVLPTGYANNQAMRKDHDAAIAAGIPVMVVDNVEDFADAMSALDALNSTTQIYTLNSHGYAGSFNIGSDEINANTDFSKLRQGLDNKMVFIGACNVGDLAKGSELLEKMSSQTASTVIAPSHRVASGYKYDGTSLNRSISIPLSSLPNDNEFLLSKKGTSVEVIKNVHISNLGIGWDVSSGRTTPPLPNIKNIIHHNWK